MIELVSTIDHIRDFFRYVIYENLIHHVNITISNFISRIKMDENPNFFLFFELDIENGFEEMRGISTGLLRPGSRVPG